MSSEGPSGVAIIDKAAGLTSHDVVARARKILNTRKIGHSGTLDPDATGVLILGVGRATRLLRFLTALPKRYVADVVLGVETTTLDAAGEITATHDMSGVTLDDVDKGGDGFCRRDRTGPTDGFCRQGSTASASTSWPERARKSSASRAKS